MSKLISYTMENNEVRQISSLSDIPVSPFPAAKDMGTNMKNFWDISPYDLASTCLNIEINMSTFFNALHKVTFQSGEEGEVHQHSYHLKISAKGEYRHDNIVTPFADLRKILNKISSIYEGKFLNDLPPFREMQPTTENFTAVLAYQIKNMAANLSVEIMEISLFESPTIGVTISLK